MLLGVIEIFLPYEGNGFVVLVDPLEDDPFGGEFPTEFVERDHGALAMIEIHVSLEAYFNYHYLLINNAFQGEQSGKLSIFLNCYFNDWNSKGPALFFHVLEVLGGAENDTLAEMQPFKDHGLLRDKVEDVVFDDALVDAFVIEVSQVLEAQFDNHIF